MTPDAVDPPRRPAVGVALIYVIGAVSAALLLVPAVFLWLGIIATLGALGLTTPDATWNDGDAGIGWAVGGFPTLIVLAVAGASVGAIARRFGLKTTRTWVTTVAVVFAIALVGGWLLAVHGF